MATKTVRIAPISASDVTKGVTLYVKQHGSATTLVRRALQSAESAAALADAMNASLALNKPAIASLGAIALRATRIEKTPFTVMKDPLSKGMYCSALASEVQASNRAGTSEPASTDTPASTDASASAADKVHAAAWRKLCSLLDTDAAITPKALQALILNRAGVGKQSRKPALSAVDAALKAELAKAA